MGIMLILGCEENSKVARKKSYNPSFEEVAEPTVYNSPVDCEVTIKRSNPDTSDVIVVPVKAISESDAKAQAKLFFEANYSGPNTTYSVVGVDMNVQTDIL